MCEEVHSGFPILMIRCSRHPLNVKQNNDLIMLDTSIAFRPILNGLIGYLQECKTFKPSMGSQHNMQPLDRSPFEIH